MKGIVFTEFLELVELRWGLDLVDDLLTDAESHGVYTALGNYPHAEMWKLVNALSVRNGMSSSTILEMFGEHLCERFSELFPQYFQTTDSLSFLNGVDSYIHDEVRKLYPDAELPQVHIVERGPDRIVLQYQSDRCMSDLAVGLIKGVIQHFDESLDCERVASNESGSDVTIRVRPRDAEGPGP